MSRCRITSGGRRMVVYALIRYVTKRSARLNMAIVLSKLSLLAPLFSGTSVTRIVHCSKVREKKMLPGRRSP